MGDLGEVVGDIGSKTVLVREGCNQLKLQSHRTGSVSRISIDATKCGV